MNLYEITQEMQALDECYELGVDPETGEFNPNADFNQKLEELGQNLNKKLDSIYKFLRNTATDISTTGDEIARLQKIKRQKQNKLDWYKKYILNCMINTGDKKWECSIGSFSTRNSQKLTILDGVLDMENDNLWRVHKEPNKEYIKKLLKNGETVKGAVLEDSVSLIIK